MKSRLDERTDNYTLYGIHDKTDRDLLAAYSWGIVLSCLVGDTLILVGSLRYKAIKLHKVLVVFIQYIAVADLAIAIFRVLPGAVSLTANEWVLGEFLCYFEYCVTCSVGGTICILVSALSLTKLLIVKYPLRAVSLSTGAAHFTVLGSLLYSMCLPLLSIISDKHGVYFNFLDYNCDYYSPSEDSIIPTITSALVGLSGVVTTTITVVSSFMLIAIARNVAMRGPGELQWQGIVTVLLTAAAYLLSTLPGSVYLLGSYFVDPSQPEIFHFWRVYLYRFSAFIAILNVLFNFYIYTLTLTSFREFLWSRIKVASAALCVLCYPEESPADLGERRALLH